MNQTQDFLALERQRRQAMINADIAILSDLFADDMLWIHGNGRSDTKSGVLASIQSRKSIYQAIDCSDETVRAYGDVAFVSGLAEIKACIAGEDRLMRNRFTVAWSRTGGRWQMVNWQSTAMPAPSH